MFSQIKIVSGASLVATALFLSGCGSEVKSGTKLTALSCIGSMVPNAGNTECVAPPPPICDLPLVLDTVLNECGLPPDPNAPPPSIFARVDEAILFYNRPQDATNQSNDPAYEGWKLHTWSNETCDAYVDGDTDWPSGRVHDGVDANYGAYWILAINPGYAGTDGACGNFILHKGTSGDAGTDDGKEMQGGDFRMSLSQAGQFARMNWTFSGVASVFENPLASLGVSLGDASAHWIESSTLMLNVDTSNVATAKLYYSSTADLEIEGEALINGQSMDLTLSSLTDEQKAAHPQVADLEAFTGAWSQDDAKGMLKNQLVVATFNADNELLSANKVQVAKVIDDLYTSGDADADEAIIGLIYEGDTITANLWAPTAQTVKLMVFGADKALMQTNDMTLDPVSGVWSFEGTSSALDRMFYRYEVTVYHPLSGKVEVLQTTDPYSVSLSMNSEYSQFVNLADDDLKPDGWDSHDIPTIENFEDAVLYEGHIRDFSVLDQSTSEMNRGKYMAFTEADSLPVTHLTNLAEKGVTHFHMLPANDIATVNEDESQTVSLSSTVAELCALKSDAKVCAEADGAATLQSVLEDYDQFSEPQAAQELANDIRGLDRFNWGYDPYHFTAPEGSYASDPDGVARIVEMRAMNQALHEMGLRVVLDVVYNHTNASGLNDKSVLDKVVPGYYHRYDVGSGSIVRETCCDDTEPRNRMMEKLMEDSLLVWTEHYKFDSFRFDIMSQATKDTMVRLETAVQEIDEDNYFYGEGWTRTDRQYEQANQPNMAGTEIGTFNDRIREAVRQGEIFAKEDSEAALSAQDRVKMSLAGTLTNYVLKDSKGADTNTSNLGGYATDPADIINYVSKHDNETLWDQFNYVLPSDLSLAERVRAQNIGATIPLVAQGIPFLQLGGDFLRSKSMDRNTYDSGDWFSRVDFTMASNNWNVGLPLAQDNQSRWMEMAGFIYSPERAASMSEIEFASDVFNEILSIRSSSKLFRLTSADEIIDRVGFHNIGSRQTQGLIVMSIDDGVSGNEEAPRADIDPMVDAVVVVINTGYEERSHTVNTAAGFELHSVQAMSVDPTVRDASFTAQEGTGTFTVPALTTAVFVKSQMGAQGEGLSAIATAGAPDVVPYGSTGVYLRGTFSDWANPAPADAQFAYQGDGIYTVDIEITEGVEHMFKVAKGDWDNGDESLDLGATSDSTNVVTVDEDLVLAANGGPNLAFTAAETAVYKITLDASDTSAPIINIGFEEPFFGVPVFIRGAMNDWGEANQMGYEVGGVYSATLNVAAGSYEFKVASSDWSTVDYGLQASDNVVTVGEQRVLDGTDNMAITFDADGEYSFIFDASNLDEPTITVYSAEYFGDTTVYIRGGMNDWGEVDATAYQGAGVYSADLALDAGSYEFKVASADWSTFNLGGSEAGVNVPIGDGVSIIQGGENLLLDIDISGTYRFSVEGPDPTAPTVTVTEVE